MAASLMIPLLILTDGVLKLLTVFALSSVKFFFMLFGAYAWGLSFWEALATTIAGGILGSVFFYYLSGLILDMLSQLNMFSRKEVKVKQAKTFSRKNRLIVRTKSNYGLIGIAIITPVVLSIPVGIFIIRKYYSKKPYALAITCATVVVWSTAILTGLYAV